MEIFSLKLELNKLNQTEKLKKQNSERLFVNDYEAVD